MSIPSTFNSRRMNMFVSMFFPNDGTSENIEIFMRILYLCVQNIELNGNIFEIRFRVDWILKRYVLVSWE